MRVAVLCALLLVVLAALATQDNSAEAKWMRSATRRAWKNSPKNPWTRSNYLRKLYKQRHQAQRRQQEAARQKAAEAARAKRVAEAQRRRKAAEAAEAARRRKAAEVAANQRKAAEAARRRQAALAAKQRKAAEAARRRQAAEAAQQRKAAEAAQQGKVAQAQAAPPGPRLNPLGRGRPTSPARPKSSQSGGTNPNRRPGRASKARKETKPEQTNKPEQTDFQSKDMKQQVQESVTGNNYEGFMSMMLSQTIASAVGSSITAGATVEAQNMANKAQKEIAASQAENERKMAAQEQKVQLLLQKREFEHERNQTLLEKDERLAQAEADFDQTVKELEKGYNQTVKELENAFNKTLEEIFDESSLDETVENWKNLTYVSNLNADLYFSNETLGREPTPLESDMVEVEHNRNELLRYRIDMVIPEGRSNQSQLERMSRYPIISKELHDTVGNINSRLADRKLTPSEEEANEQSRAHVQLVLDMLLDNLHREEFISDSTFEKHRYEAEIEAKKSADVQANNTDTQRMDVDFQANSTATQRNDPDFQANNTHPQRKKRSAHMKDQETLGFYAALSSMRENEASWDEIRDFVERSPVLDQLTDQLTQDIVRSQLIDRELELEGKLISTPKPVCLCPPEQSDWMDLLEDPVLVPLPSQPGGQETGDTALEAVLNALLVMKDIGEVYQRYDHQNPEDNPEIPAKGPLDISFLEATMAVLDLEASMADSSPRSDRHKRAAPPGSDDYDYYDYWEGPDKDPGIIFLEEIFSLPAAMVDEVNEGFKWLERAFKELGERIQGRDQPQRRSLGRHYGAEGRERPKPEKWLFEGFGERQD